MANYLNAFNNHFEEFVNDVVTVFPEDIEIAAASNALCKLRKANPKIIIKVFYKHVYLPHGSQIKENNINYFIEKDYTEYLTNPQVGFTKEVLDKINSIKEPISNMNQHEQLKVIKYLQNLCKLCDLYHSTQLSDGH